MFPLAFPVTYETWFYWLALLLSTVLGVRGIAIQMNNVENENRARKKKDEVEWNQWQRILVHYLQDFIYNFVGSLAGWVALYMLSYRLFMDTGANVPPLPQNFVLDKPNLHSLGWIDLWLVIFALLGITGKLPQTAEGFILSIAKAIETITSKLSKN